MGAESPVLFGLCFLLPPWLFLVSGVVVGKFPDLPRPLVSSFWPYRGPLASRSWSFMSQVLELDVLRLIQVAVWIRRAGAEIGDSIGKLTLRGVIAPNDLISPYI